MQYQAMVKPNIALQVEQASYSSLLLPRQLKMQGMECFKKELTMLYIHSYTAGKLLQPAHKSKRNHLP